MAAACRCARSGPAMRPALVALHGRLSEESVYLRYFSPHSRLSPREIDHATGVDHRDREALVALEGDQLIGVASYERQPGSDAAEVAFEVEDAHQGRGIGTVLFEALAATARTRGIRRFFAHVLPQNRRMLQLFRDVGLERAGAFRGRRGRGGARRCRAGPCPRSLRRS